MRPKVQFQAQKAPFFKILEEILSGKGDSGRAVISDSSFPTLLSCCVILFLFYIYINMHASKHIYIYKQIYIHTYEYIHIYVQKWALRLQALPWCNASFLILEALKLKDEAILITSWETKTVFRWVAWLHSNSLLLLVCFPKIPILPSKSPWIHNDLNSKHAQLHQKSHQKPWCCQNRVC